MIDKIYDFATPEKLIFEQITAELEARTPEEVARDKAESKAGLQRLLEENKKICMNHRRVGNKKLLAEFLKVAATLRKFASQHSGWIKISVNEDWFGTIEMRFENLFFLDSDPYNSHKIFAGIFEEFKDVAISSKEDLVVVEIFKNLYDVVSTASPMPE